MPAGLRTTIISGSCGDCCRSLMWVRGFGLLVQHNGVACRSTGVGCINTTLAQSTSHVAMVRPDWVVSATWSTWTCLRWRSGHQVRQRRSNRHRGRKQQSTSSVYCEPSGLSETRRRDLDDKEGHLIYNNGDILHSRCTHAFVYLLIRRWVLITFMVT